MKENYQNCLKRTLQWEGGYVNHPSDPGGPTKYGITIHTYRKFINPNASAKDIESMTINEAKAIYKPQYWDKVKGDTLPVGIDLCVFDYGVNSGPARANRVYKQYMKLEDSEKIINAICDERLRFMKAIDGGAKWKVFGKGWGNRVADIRKASINMTKTNKALDNTVAATIGTAATAGAALNFDLLIQHWPFTLAAAVALGFIIYKLVRK